MRASNNTRASNNLILSKSYQVLYCIYLWSETNPAGKHEDRGCFVCVVGVGELVWGWLGQIFAWVVWVAWIHRFLVRVKKLAWVWRGSKKLWRG